MDFESRIINKSDNTENSKLLSPLRSSSPHFTIDSHSQPVWIQPHQNVHTRKDESRPHYRAIHLRDSSRNERDDDWKGVARRQVGGWNIHSFHLTPLSSLLFRSVIPSLCRSASSPFSAKICQPLNIYFPIAKRKITRTFMHQTLLCCDWWFSCFDGRFFESDDGAWLQKQKINSWHLPQSFALDRLAVEWSRSRKAELLKAEKLFPFNIVSRGGERGVESLF